MNTSGLPYEFLFGKDDWAEDPEGLKIVIPAGKHHRGQRPECIVQIEEENEWKDAGAHISMNEGDIVIRSDIRFDGRAIIKL